MIVRKRETELEIHYPLVPWREPIKVTRTDGACGYACRFCIAIKGLKADDIPDLAPFAYLVREHILLDHGVVPEGNEL
jgi:hypothetical protein